MSSIVIPSPSGAVHHIAPADEERLIGGIAASWQGEATDRARGFLCDHLGARDLIDAEWERLDTPGCIALAQRVSDVTLTLAMEQDYLTDLCHMLLVRCAAPEILGPELLRMRVRHAEMIDHVLGSLRARYGDEALARAGFGPRARPLPDERDRTDWTHLRACAAGRTTVAELAAECRQWIARCHQMTLGALANHEVPRAEYEEWGDDIIHLVDELEQIAARHAEAGDARRALAYVARSWEAMGHSAPACWLMGLSDDERALAADLLAHTAAMRIPGRDEWDLRLTVGYLREIAQRRTDDTVADLVFAQLSTRTSGPAAARRRARRDLRRRLFGSSTAHFSCWSRVAIDLLAPPEDPPAGIRPALARAFDRAHDMALVYGRQDEWPEVVAATRTSAAFAGWRLLIEPHASIRDLADVSLVAWFAAHLDGRNVALGVRTVSAGELFRGDDDAARAHLSDAVDDLQPLMASLAPDDRELVRAALVDAPFMAAGVLRDGPAPEGIITDDLPQIAAIEELIGHRPCAHADARVVGRLSVDAELSWEEEGQPDSWGVVCDSCGAQDVAHAPMRATRLSDPDLAARLAVREGRYRRLWGDVADADAEWMIPLGDDQPPTAATVRRAYRGVRAPAYVPMTATDLSTALFA